MYTYELAYAKAKGSQSKWEIKDLANVGFATIYRLYQEVVFELGTPFWTQHRALWLSDIPDRFGLKARDETPVEFFQRIDNKTLPTNYRFPTLDRGYVMFQDAFRAGYTVQPIDRETNKTYGLLKKELTDLRITRYDMDTQQFYDYCLVTVNGLLHRTNNTGLSVNALDGATSGFHADANQVGILSFKDIGKINCVSIQESQVFNDAVDQSLTERVYLKVDDSAGDITNKTVMLSIGGYLMLPGQTNEMVQRVGNRTFTVDFANYPWSERFFEMRHLLPLKELTQGFERNSLNTSQVALKDLYNEQTVKRLFTMSQSFFIVVDTNEIVAEKDIVQFNGLPDSYIAYQKPIFPLVAGTGRFYEYWPRHEYDCWVLSTEGTLQPNYVYQTTNWRDKLSIDESRVPSNPSYYTDAFYWKLSSDIIRET